MNEPLLIRPFGPVIYQNVVADDVYQILHNCQRVSQSVNDNVGYLLAGALETQLNLIRTPEQNKIIMDHIMTHVAMYVDGNLEVVKKKFYIPNNNIWLNVQGPGEFNPAHHHSGDISGVIYLQIPKEIKAENKKKSNSFFEGYGNISFYYGEDISCTSYYHHYPSTGQILLFPAKLKHAVHPFYSDVQRISIAFNVFKERDDSRTDGSSIY